MDFFKALGLDAEVIPSPEAMAEHVAGSKAPLLPVLLTPPDPLLICDKLLRLERYCTAGLRPEVTIAGDQTLTLAPIEGDQAPLVGWLWLLRGLLLRAGLQRVEIDGLSVTWHGLPEWQAPDTGASARLTDHLQKLLESDPARGWRIGEAAAHLGLSERSLQRYLLAEGASFSEALRQARTTVATNLLRKSALSLAEIGFACGYADQAHFQREFKKASGQTPRGFRKHGGKMQKRLRTAL